METRQVAAILNKNLKRSLADPKKLLLNLIFPISVSIILILSKRSPQMSSSRLILQSVLTLIIGIVNFSQIKQTINLFISQRQQGFRSYQFVMGMGRDVHFVANLIFAITQSLVYSIPFLITLNCYTFRIAYFFSFISFAISSNCLVIALTSIFTDHKLATQIIGLLYFLCSLLPIFSSSEHKTFSYFLSLFLPNSSFTMAVQSSTGLSMFTTSLISLSWCFVYLFVYYVLEFSQNALANFNHIANQLKSKLGLGQDMKETGTNQIEIITNQTILQTPPILQLQNISKYFDNFQAINNLSLKLNKSEIVGLLGRNGAGKTTIVDIITKVTQQTTGKVKTSKKDEHFSIGICYQHEILYEDLTVHDHLKFYSQIKPIQNTNDQIEEIWKKVSIEEQLNKKVRELSGGNKRKLSFCIALLGNPDILIFDEPTSGLDPLSRRNIWKTLDALRSSEVGIILTTHHLDQADYLSDKIYILKKGQIIQQGSPNEIKKKYGRGDYLRINSNSESTCPFPFKVYNRIIKQFLPLSKLVDRNQDYLKYFVDKNQNYEKLIECVQKLQKIDGISISMEPNSLEQSFIAIEGETSWIKDDIEIQTQATSPSSQISRAQRHLQQILGTLLKNFYCYTSKFHWIYNMNLIILFLVFLINDLLINKILYPSQDDQNNTKTNFIFIVEGYIIMTSAFLSIPVLEKEEKIMMVLRARGLSMINYWVGQFVFDLLYFLLNYLVLLITITDKMKNISFILILGTGCCIILYSYTFSMVFQSVKTASSWFTGLNTLFIILMVPVMMPANLIKDTLFMYLSPLKYLCPFFDLSYAFVKLDKIMVDMETQNGSSQSPTLYICLLVYLAIFLLLQTQIIQKMINKTQNLNGQKQICLNHVGHTYGQIKALNDVTYSIHNQRVALLGHNGAGKSTSFGILSGQLYPAQGEVYLEKKLRGKYDKALNSAGICFQEDTLWKFLTPQKILRIFRYIIPRCKSDDIVEIFQNLDIEPHVKATKLLNLSGGNKRKICMAVCLLGNPEIKLLDECSTGLDPVSQLAMANTIKMHSEGTTILTTHSIPEAEKICERVIIMKKGQVLEDCKIFKLKQKYYDCYWITLVTQNFTSAVQQIFPHFSQNQMTLLPKNNVIQIGKKSIKLSNLMQLLHNQINGCISDFSIDEPKFEDVYIHLAKNEKESDLESERT